MKIDKNCSVPEFGDLVICYMDYATTCGWCNTSDFENGSKGGGMVFVGNMKNNLLCMIMYN